jgi:RNA polymerase sigma-70 factor (ECF subfamily)
MTTTDEELISRMAQGDRGALEALYRRHSPWIAGRLAAATSSRDLADEALQAAFLGAWRSARSYRSQGEVAAWLWGIARRRLVSLSRKRTDIPAQLVAPDIPGVDEIVLSREEAMRVREAVAHLPKDQRAAIEGVVFQDRPLAEVARSLGVPAGTLKSRLHRARLHIKEELASR